MKVSFPLINFFEVVDDVPSIITIKSKGPSPNFHVEFAFNHMG